MVDPVSMAASVMTVAGTALEIGGRMISLAKELAAAGEEMEDFGTDLQLFYMAVDLSLNCLDRYLKTPTLKDSPVLKNLEKTGGFELLKQKSRQTKRRIHKAWKVAKLVQSKVFILKDTFTAINWVFRKPELLALRPELEAYKTSISLIITSLALEMKLDSLTELESIRGSIPESIFEEKLAEIEDLKAQISVQVKTIALSQEREERRLQLRRAQSPGTPEGQDEQRETLEDILMDIGTSLTEHGSASNPEGSSSSSSMMTYSTRRPSALATNASTPPSTPLPASPRSSHRVQEPYTSNRLSFPEPPVDMLLQKRARKGKMTARKTHGIQGQQQNQLPDITPLRHKQQLIAADSTPVPLGWIGSSVSGHQDVVSIRQTPSPDEPQIFVETQTSRVSGYINTPDGLVPAKVQLTTKFPAHAISANYVNLLGLSVEPYGDGSDEGTRKAANFYSNGEEVVSIGEVTLQWRGALTTPPFNISCRVFPDQSVNLVLGKSFLEKRNFYANGGEDEDGGEWMR